MHAFTRKTSTWLLSSGLHALLFLGFAFFWVVKAEGDVLGCPRFRLPGEKVEAPRFPDREAEVHPPFDPKEFQPDPEIINVAREVVVNTIPDEIDSVRLSGEQIALTTPSPFKSTAAAGTVGIAGGGARLGAYAGRFG